MKLFKLGTKVKDKASGIDGMLTVASIDMDGGQQYAVQPCALNPKTKLPLEPFWINSSRVVGGKEVKIELPINVISSEVEDMATGLKGTVICLNYHLSGCVHLEIKPKGTIKETGETIKCIDIDIRRLKGKEIPVLTEKELDEDKKKKPSPGFMPSKDKK